MKQDLARWSEKTSADLFTPSQWRTFCTDRSFYVVGWMGFAGSWKRSGLRGAALDAFVEDMNRSVEGVLLEHKARYGNRLVVASGATNLGVLQVVYQQCARHGVLALGIAPDRVLNYSLGAMNFAVPYGKNFGDESELFVDLCSSFVLVGGGPQSKHETRAALTRGKDVVVVRGFGGVADQVSWERGLGAERVTFRERSG